MSSEHDDFLRMTFIELESDDEAQMRDSGYRRQTEHDQDRDPAKSSFHPTVFEPRVSVEIEMNIVYSTAQHVDIRFEFLCCKDDLVQVHSVHDEF